MREAPRFVVRKTAGVVVTTAVSTGSANGRAVAEPESGRACIPGVAVPAATAAAAVATADVEGAAVAESARRRESVAAVLLPGAGTGVGKRIGVRIRTAAIRTTARTMRRGSMVLIGERSGHRIESAGPERMTAPDSAQRHPSST
jgi:hypothetical protein